MNTQTTTTAYDNLESRFRKIQTLGDAQGMLHWDMSTMMPPGVASARADQLAVLATLGHGLLVDPALADLLADAAEQPLSPWQAANLHEMRRIWTHATALDESLVEALSKAGSACEQVWRDAHPAGDFKMVLPYLEEVLSLTRTAAAAKAERLGCSPYDALLDSYEPDGRSVDIDVLFADLESFLPDFTQAVLERQKAAAGPVAAAGPFSITAQRDLGTRLMAAVGFDFNHGRLDVSRHPFCGGIPDDVRITTRYDEANFTSAMMGVLHETGHAMYERGLPADWRTQPVGQARGMSLHESQSLLVEMQVCRSREFLAFAAPLMKAAFDGQGPAWSADNLYRLYTRVEPDFIRVNADEVTYPAHVILRYRLETAMINGDLRPRDLPGAWNEQMEAMLGITPASDRDGCLQDIHWYDGAWGYFPTYTLGAMSAAQIFAAAKTAAPDIPAAIAKGDFGPLMTWLKTQVHAQGSRRTSGELMTHATGRPLDTTAFKFHLRSRYLP